MLTAGNLNIYAVVWSNICFALIVSVLNAIAIARFLHYRQEWKRTFLIPVIVSIIMGAAAYLVYQAVPSGVWQYDLRAVCNSGRGGNLRYRADFL